MDFIDLASQRYSVRKFSDKSVEKEKLDLLLKAARLAPTAANAQPQRILVINSKEALEKLDKCTPYRFDAPLALLVCYDREECWQRRYDRQSSGFIDASIITTHMMLEAANIGLGTTWVMHFDPEKVVKAYNVPENFIPVSILVTGYPADSAKPSKMHEQREPIEKSVFYNEFPKK